MAVRGQRTRESMSSSKKIGMMVYAHRDGYVLRNVKPYSNWLKSVSVSDMRAYAEHNGVKLRDKFSKMDIIDAVARDFQRREAKEETKGMRTLTNEQLDVVIAKADKIYDQKIGKAGDYIAYHDIAMMVCVGDGLLEYVSQYDSRVIDARIEEVNKNYDDDRVDADLDAYSRRFDCEV